MVMKNELSIILCHMNKMWVILIHLSYMCIKVHLPHFYDNTTYTQVTVKDLGSLVTHLAVSFIYRMNIDCTRE